MRSSTIRRKFRSVAAALALLLAAPVAAQAALQTDPLALYKTMKAAYDRGVAGGWRFADDVYYFSTVLDAGRAYELVRRTDPDNAALKGFTVDVATKLHYNPLTSRDAAEWYVRLAAAANVNDAARGASARALLQKLDAEDADPARLARDADADATLNVALAPNDAEALIEQVDADVRAYLLTKDPQYRSLALLRAAQPVFPIAMMADDTAKPLLALGEDARKGAEGYSPVDRQAAAAMFSHRAAAKNQQIIGRVLSHNAYLVITAPADEYFGQTKLSPLGVRNELTRIGRYLDAGWGNRMTHDMMWVIDSLQDWQHQYPRDYELPRLLLQTYNTLGRIDSPEAKKAGSDVRRTLTIDYNATNEARSLLMPGMMDPAIAGALARYDRAALTLCSIGSHSALDVAAGAAACGLRNLIVTERGRDRTYAEFYARRTNPDRGCVDATLELATFTDLLNPGVQEKLLAQNVLFIANRSFEVYLHQKFSYDEIERGMRVPFFGNRHLLRAEERDEADNQYALMERAGVPYPLQFTSPDRIDRLVMVKAPHATISFERAFFLVRTPAEYEAKAEQLIAAGIVTREGVANAVIEEFALGPTVNLNFFYSPMLGELELLGTDTRRQTNLDGLRGLPFSQAQQLADEPVRMEEAGHIATTLTESMLEKAFEMGERFVRATQAAGAPGVIGPFALQCVIVAGPPKRFICYDVSLRIPGSPGTRYTPYTAYRWGRDVSVGERIAMEVVMARDAQRLGEVLT